MEGRSLGTERPSVSTSTNGASADRFRSLLTARAAATGREVRSSTEDTFAARITDGRTDAAEASDDQRDTVRARSEAPTREADSAPERRESDTQEGEREPSRERHQGDGSSSRRDGDSLSGEERSKHVVDANDARGADEPDAEDAADGVTAPLQSAADSRPLGAVPAAARAAQSGAQAPALAPALAAGLPGAAPATGAANPRVDALAPSAQTSRAASTRATAQASAPQRSTAAERAEAILDQLKVQIRAGAREAVIHLRPDELGRLELKVRTEAGGVRASLGAESAETLRVLEAHAPELRAWLAKDSGGPVELEFTLLDGGASDQPSDPGANTDGTGDGAGAERSPRRATATASAALSKPLHTALAAASNDQGVDLVA